METENFYFLQDMHTNSLIEAIDEPQLDLWMVQSVLLQNQLMESISLGADWYSLA